MTSIVDNLIRQAILARTTPEAIRGVLDALFRQIQLVDRQPVAEWLSAQIAAMLNQTQGTDMDFYEALAMDVQKQDAAKNGMQGKVDDFIAYLAQAFRQLSALNVNWSDIFAKITQIIAIIRAGGGWQNIITAILALFGLGAAQVTLSAPQGLS